MSRLLAHCPASVQTSRPKASPPPGGCTSGPADVQPWTSDPRLSVCITRSLKKKGGKAPKQEFEDWELGCFA